MYRCFVAIGDSLTEGYGDEIDGMIKTPWPIGVGKILGIETVHNLGISGYRSDQVYEFQFHKALALKPDIVSIMVGGNDLFQYKWNKKKYSNILKEMIEEFTKSGATVITGNLPDFTYMYKLPLYKKLAAKYLIKQENKVLDKLAKEYNTIHIVFYNHPLQLDKSNWSKDCIHPNSKGYDKIATEISNTIINWEKENNKY